MRDIWDKLKYFSPDENWGDPEKMDENLLKALDAWRGYMASPFIIHWGYATRGHNLSGDHPKGLAVDGHFKTKTSFKEQIRRTLHFLKISHLDDKISLGIYPDWKHQGFHFGYRGKKARWGAMYRKLSNGKIIQEYHSFEYIFDRIKH